MKKMLIGFENTRFFLRKEFNYVEMKNIMFINGNIPTGS